MRLPDRSLRVLTVTHNYPRFPGDPAGAFVARIAEGVAEGGHQVQVIAPHAAGLPLEEEIRGVRVRRFRYAADSLERVAYTGGLHHGTLLSPMAALGFPGFLLAFARGIGTMIRQMAPDVVHAHWWFPGGWLSSRSSVPYLITCHGSDIRLLARSGLVRLVARKVFAGAAKVTAVSQFLARDIERFLPAVQDATVTPMPVDVRQFSDGLRSAKAEPPRILYAGNLVPSKGVDLLLGAAAELTRRDVKYQLKILGQGPAQKSLQSLAESLRIAPQVSWSPFVPQTQMPSEYGASTITVLPTRGQAEGLGLTLVEALLAGSAVVGTPAGGIPEVIRHEETGLLARAGDPGDMADQLQRLLTDPDLRMRLSRAGREYALRTYSPDVTVERFLEIYGAVAHR
jgi:glycosyltransferase involved in cell wall biosynthesis